LISGTEVKDEAPLDSTCQTHRVRLVGAHGYSKTLFINLVQHYGIDTEVAKYLCQAYGDRAWTVAALCAPTEQRFPVRGKKVSTLYPYVDGEVRYCVRHEYAQTATDVIARRMRLAFLNAQAALESLPMVIDIMAEELKWDAKRKDAEFKNSVHFLGSMGLPKNKLSLTRKDVESGHVGKYADEEYQLYARHGESSDEESCANMFSFGIALNKIFLDKPEELLQSDSKFAHGHNPVVGKDSPVNK
jgi:glycerol-3-phosphate dehydrogenase